MMSVILSVHLSFTLILRVGRRQNSSFKMLVNIILKYVLLFLNCIVLSSWYIGLKYSLKNSVTQKSLIAFNTIFFYTLVKQIFSHRKSPITLFRKGGKINQNSINVTNGIGTANRKVHTKLSVKLVWLTHYQLDKEPLYGTH